MTTAEFPYFVRNCLLTLSCKLTAAQVAISDDEEQIDLFFEIAAAPLRQSIIIVADKMINPLVSIVETSRIAGS
jgi:hypothetical protein